VKELTVNRRWWSPPPLPLPPLPLLPLLAECAQEVTGACSVRKCDGDGALKRTPGAWLDDKEVATDGNEEVPEAAVAP